MTTQSSTKAGTSLDAFKSLSPQILYYDPVDPHTAFGDNNNTSWQSNPALIVICAWFGATRRPLARYVDRYRALMPKARILILFSSFADMVYTSDSTQQKRLGPAIAVVEAVLREMHSPNSKRAVLQPLNEHRGLQLHSENDDAEPHQRAIMLHIFSNGGTQTACQLGMLARRKLGRPLPLRTLILDSCPGRASYRLSVAAVIAALPKNQLPVVRIICTILLYCIMVVVVVIGFLLDDNVIDKGYRRLNDNELFDAGARRCYLYSKSDPMVLPGDVEAHAALAKAAGFRNVDVVRFEKSTHVAHILEDAEKYWEAVTKISSARIEG